MRFFGRNKSEPQPVPVTEQTYISNQPQGSKIDWKRAIPRLLAALALLAILVFGVIWGVGALMGDDPKPKDEKKPAISQEDSKKTREAAERERLATSRSSTADTQVDGVNRAPQDRPNTENTTVTPGEAPSRTLAGAAIENSGRLADTGPKETIAVFVLATAAGTLAYHTVLRRRLN